MVAFDCLIMKAIHRWWWVSIGGGIACGLLVWYAWAVICARDRLAVPQHRAALLTRGEIWRIVLRVVLYMVAIGIIGVGILEPVYRFECAPDEKELGTSLRRDVVIACDVSRSMLCADVVPNRLSLAKRMAHYLVDHLQMERVALLVFAGDAVVQCPLTVDRSAAHMFIDALEGDSISAGNTDLASPILRAAQLLRQEGAEGNKVIVMITDGEDSSGSLDHAIQSVQRECMTVAVIGVGSEAGAPVPRCNEQGMIVGYEKNGQGSVILSSCQHRALAALTEACGGVYCKADGVNDPSESCVRVAAWVQKHEARMVVDSPRARDRVEPLAGHLCGIALFILMVIWGVV